MERIMIEVPAMYGDHHVIEARRILLEVPGINEVFASSYLKTIEVAFDPAQVSEKDIKATLTEAGYLQEVAFPQETGTAAYGQEGNSTFFRHTAAYAQTGKTVGFAQVVNTTQRPLIPCPGMQPIKTMNEDE